MIRSQTIVMGACFIIIIAIMILNVFLPTKESSKTLFDKSNFIILLVILFVLLPISLVKLYAVNCMLEGNCNLFVYILEFMLIAITLGYVIMFIMKILKHKKQIIVAEEKYIKK